MKKGDLNKTVMDPRTTFAGLPITLDEKPEILVKYPLDSKREVRRLVVHNNHANGRNFRINEELMKIYEQNIILQCKLDEIQAKGAGNYSPRTLNKTSSHFKSPHDFTVKKRLPSISKVEHV